MNKQYKFDRIRIAFNPTTERFETTTPILAKDPAWVSDVHEVFTAASTMRFVRDYLAANPDADEDVVERNFERLMGIKHAQIGIITLADGLEIEEVTEIFVRINSKGVPLSSADFVMSKISAYGERGRNLRKYIDYFSHLAVAPHAIADIGNDAEFAASGHLSRILWLKSDTEDLYDPSYVDVIRVISLVGFGRGRMSAVVSELSGRDPDTRQLSADLVPKAYDKVENALNQIVNEHNFKQFLMTIKSTGFIDRTMLVARNAVNFAYALYLSLRADPQVMESEAKRIVRRWFVLTVLTNRASGSFETTFEADMKRIAQSNAAEVLKHLESTELSDAFWEVELPSLLNTSSIRSPYFQTFLASQVAAGAKGFLSKDISVQAMLEQRGDIHHLVPKEYLRTHGVNDRQDYNQVANFSLTETPINIRIGKRSPADYMGEVEAQIAGGPNTLGEIASREQLLANLAANAVPATIASVTSVDYESFLQQRRILMAAAIRKYYDRL